MNEAHTLFGGSLTDSRVTVTWKQSERNVDKDTDALTEICNADTTSEVKDTTAIVEEYIRPCTLDHHALCDPTETFGNVFVSKGCQRLGTSHGTLRRLEIYARGVSCVYRTRDEKGKIPLDEYPARSWSTGMIPSTGIGGISDSLVWETKCP
jgi:hypothetical protein